MKIALFLFLFQSFAWADWTDIEADQYSVAEPPAEGSRAFERDYEQLVEFQETERKKECALARKQKWPNYDAFFKGSGILTAAELASARPLVSRVMKYSVNVAVVYKNEYLRSRPYDVDERIQPCVEKPGGSKAYPSSHAVSASVGACVLGLIFPDKKAELEEYGTYLGDIRMIVGVHHPSDVRAGQKLGKDICHRLAKESDFKAEVKDAR